MTGKVRGIEKGAIGGLVSGLGLLVLMLSFLVGGVMAPVHANEQTQTFSDMTDHWAEEAVYNMLSKGLIQGYSDGSFRPQQVVSKGEMATIAINALGLREQVQVMGGMEPTYSDVGERHWALGQVELAREYSLFPDNDSSYYEAGDFGVNQKITREELAVVLAGMLKVTTAEQGQGGTAHLYFSDRESISHWAKEAVGQVVDARLMEGFGDGKFHPLEQVTRAQATTVIYRLLSEQGKAQQFYGQIYGGAPQDNEVEIKVGQQVVTFTMAAEGVYSTPGGLRDWHELDILTPVYFNLNAQGEIIYLQQALQLQEIAYDIEVSGYNPDLDGYDEVYRQKVRAINANSAKADDAKADDAAGFNSVAMTYESTEMILTPEFTGAEIGAEELKQKMGVDGKRVKVALVDTGIDPGHPDLQETTDGSRKIAAYLDVTREGLVQLTGSPIGLGQLESRLLPDPMTVVLVPDVLEQQVSQVFVGLPGDESLKDFTLKHEHLEPAAFLEALEKEIEAGNVETVGARGYGLFAEAGQVLAVPTGSGPLNMAVVDIDPRGKWVQLAFDGNGHGTHVAGIIGAQGKLNGIAPGAELVVVKALDSIGESDVPTLKRGIQAAVDSGAQVINLSLGFQLTQDKQVQDMKNYLQQLVAEYGITFVVASGNTGPGIGSVAVPGVAPEVLTVGAYISPKMWREEYGLKLDQEILWDYSGVGPNKSGGMKPEVMAPGVVWSTYPLWAGDGYFWDEGTSMAAPQVAAVVALMLEAAAGEGLSPSPLELKAAIIAGAQPMTGLTQAEQGHGRVDAVSSWNALVQELRGQQSGIDGDGDSGSVSGSSDFRSQVTAKYTLGEALVDSLYLRTYPMGIGTVSLTNPTEQSVKVQLAGSDPWIKPELSSLTVPAYGTRAVPIYFNPLPRSGLHQGTIQIKQVQQLVELPVVFSVPTTSLPGQMTLEGESGAGELQRYYVRAEERLKQFEADLRIKEGADGPLGRARLHLFDPQGHEWEHTSFLGADHGYGNPKLAQSITVSDPEPGVWELVVASSSWLDHYDLSKSQYIVSAQSEKLAAADGLDSPTLSQSSGENQWLVGIPPKGAAKTNSLTQEWWVYNQELGIFYNGPLLVDDVLYFAREGQVLVQPRLLSQETVQVVLLR